MTRGHDQVDSSILPLVSIITVVFNGEKYIEETIKSVIDQSYKNIEYIVIDGGSLDTTLHILKKYETEIDLLVSESDNGLYDAMNKGIRLATGEFIKFINADDLLEKNSIQIFISEYNKFKDNNCVFNSYLNRIDSEGNTKAIWTNSSKVLKGYAAFLHPSWFVPMKIYKKFGLYSLKYPISSDYEYYLRLKKEGVCFSTIEEPLVSFRKGGVSNSCDSLADDYKIFLKYSDPFSANLYFCKIAVLKFLQLVKHKLIKILIKCKL